MACVAVAFANAQSVTVTLRPSSWPPLRGRSTTRSVAASSLTPTVEVRQVARATRALMRA